MDISIAAQWFHTTSADNDILHALLPDSPSSSRSPPEVAAFPDGEFRNYHSLGISLFYLKSGVLDRIDLYNPDPAPAPGPRRRGKKPQTPYSPAAPIALRFGSTTLPLPPRPPPVTAPGVQLNPKKEGTEAEAGQKTLTRPDRFLIGPKTTAKDFVQHLGEPSKKGGGDGWIGVYMEWSSVELLAENGRVVHLGFMVELRDPGNTPADTTSQPAPGMSVWDRVGDWVWEGIKVFKAEA